MNYFDSDHDSGRSSAGRTCKIAKHISKTKPTKNVGTEIEINIDR